MKVYKFNRCVQLKNFKLQKIYKRYNNIYRKERGLGQSHEVAKGIALDKTEEYIQKPESAIRPKYSRDETRATNIINAKKAVAKQVVSGAKSITSIQLSFS